MTEPAHLNQTVVILAGYSEQMEQMLSECNPGIKSRFTGYIEFPDWDEADCEEAICGLCERGGIQLPEDARQALSRGLAVLCRRKGWANARDANTVFRGMYKARAVRGTTPSEVHASFTVEDVESVILNLCRQRPAPPSSTSELSTASLVSDGSASILAEPSGLRSIPAFVPVSNGALERDLVRSGVDAEVALESIELSEPVEEVSSEELKIEKAVEMQHSREMMHTEAAAVDDYGNTFDSVYLTLLLACKDVGYDSSHERRIEAITMLSAVQVGAPFAADVMARVVEKTGLSEAAATRMLKPQVHRVIEGMTSAVKAENERRESKRQLQERLLLIVEEAETQRIVAEVQKKEEEHRRVAERLRTSGRCPMGFTWHQCGFGWRCAGGGHFVANDQLPNTMT
eukprot:6212011-Pleurochrysis_carterae.AAC.1